VILNYINNIELIDLVSAPYVPTYQREWPCLQIKTKENKFISHANLCKAVAVTYLSLDDCDTYSQPDNIRNTKTQFEQQSNISVNISFTIYKLSLVLCSPLAY